MITVRAPYASFVVYGLKFVENLRVSPSGALRFNGAPRWYALKQSKKWNDPLPKEMKEAIAMVRDRRTLAIKNGKIITGIVALIRVVSVFDSHVSTQLESIPTHARPWVTGGKWRYAYLIDTVIPIDPPIAAVGNCDPVGIPDQARAALIEALSEMGRVLKS
jgi:hypothetical protein